MEEATVSDTDHATYGWIIDIDHVPDSRSPEGTNANAKGVTGPHNTNPDGDRHEPEASDHVGLPTLAHGEEIRPAFSDTHPRAARELGEMIAANEKHRDTYTVHPDPNEEA